MHAGLHKWAIPPRFEVAQPFHHGEASVKLGGRWLLIDTVGHVLAESSSGWVGPRVGAFARGGTDTRWGIVGEEHRIPATLPFATTRVLYAVAIFPDSRPLEFHDGLALVSSIARHRWQVLDRSGAALAQAEFEALQYAGANRLAFSAAERWGLVDERLRQIAAPRFDEAPKWSEGAAFAFARENGSGGCIDRQGRWVVPPSPMIGEAGCEAPWFVASSTDGKGVMDMRGRWVIAPSFDKVRRLSGGTGAYFLLDRSQHPDEMRASILAVVTPAAVRYSEPGALLCTSAMSCLMQVGERWQRLDLATLKPAGPSYDRLQDNSTGHGAGVCKEAGCGYLSDAGTVVVPLAYDEIKVTDGGPAMVRVRRGTHWGAFWPDGRPAIPVRYDGFERLDDHAFKMKVGQRWGIVSDQGRELVPALYDSILVLRAELMLAKLEGHRELKTLDGRPVHEPTPGWIEQLCVLTDYSPRAWGAWTAEGRLYLIDKQTLATHELLAPAGYAWSNLTSIPCKPGEFIHTGFGHELKLRPTNPLVRTPRQDRTTVLDDTGQAVFPVLFEAVAGTLPSSAQRDRLIVTLNGRCGVVDRQGHWYAPPKYDHCDLVGPEGPGNPAHILIATDLLPRE